MNIQERHDHPSLEQAGTHRRHGVVKHTKQIHSILYRAMKKLQVTNGKSIHPEVIFLFNSLNGGDVLQIRVLGILQILKHRTRSDDTCVQVFNSKSFKGMRLEMFEQAFGAISFIKNPTLQCVGIKLMTEDLF